MVKRARLPDATFSTAAPLGQPKNPAQPVYVRWHDLSKPEGITAYLVIYEQLLVDANEQPFVASLCAPTFVSCAVLMIGCGGVLIIDQLIEDHQLQNFQVVLLALLILSGAGFVMFIYLTVALDATVAMQSKIIGKVQNDVQVQVDELKSWLLSGAEAAQPFRCIDSTVRRLEAKVNALKSLDTVIRQSDATPAVIGMSLESFRWTAVIVLLILFNCFFVMLYIFECLAMDYRRTKTRTVTPTLEI